MQFHRNSIDFPSRLNRHPIDILSKFYRRSIDILSKNDISGNISVYNNDIISEILPINGSSLIYETLNNDKVRFKFIIDSYFIKDTTISLSENKNILINLNKIEFGNRDIQSNLIFEKSSTKLIDESFPYLDDLLHIFKNNINLKITIEGHTDNSGSLKNNIRLSKERAEFIKEFLVKNGIKKGQIKVKGYGPTRPRYSNDSQEFRFKNRRVEIYINWVFISLISNIYLLKIFPKTMIFV